MFIPMFRFSGKLGQPALQRDQEVSVLGNSHSSIAE